MKKTIGYNKITTILFFSGILVMCSLYTALPLTATFSKEFKVTEGFAALNGVVFSVMYSISCLFYGTISEKFGRIKTIVFSLAGLTIICLLIGFVNSFTLLLLLRAFQGVFAASFSPISITYVTETYTISKRVTAISFISISFMLAGIIGQNLSEFIISYFDWHVVYFVLTAFYVLLSISIHKYVPESPIKNADIKVTHFLKNFKSFKTNLYVLLCYGISLTLLIIFISMYDVFNRYISSSDVDASDMLESNARLFGIVGMLIALLAGRISEKIGVKNLIIMSLVMISICLILMPFLTNLAMLVFLSVIIVSGVAFAIPTTISEVGILVNENRGFFLSVNTFILFLGTAIAPVLNIFLQGLSNFKLQFIVIFIISFIALVFSIFLPKQTSK